MIPSGGPVSSGPVSGGPLGPTTATVGPALGDIIVMHAQPFDSDAVNFSSTEPALPSGVIAETPYDVTFYGDTTDVYACSGIPGGYTTWASDTPASTYIPAIMTESFKYDFQVFADVDLLQPGAFSGGGSIAFSDPKGAYDAWLDYAWDGRDITLYRGDPTAAFSTFTQVASLTCDGWEEISHRKKSLKLRDVGWRLAERIFVPKFTGAGGAEGGADIAGAQKQLIVGLVGGIMPIPVDVNNLVFHYHAPLYGVGDSGAVQVGGVTYSFVGDFASYTDLVGATVGAGEFATCNTEGLIRLGNAFPTGQGARQYLATGVGYQAGGADFIIENVIDALGVAVQGWTPSHDVSIAGESLMNVGWFSPIGAEPPSLAGILNALTYGHGWYWWPGLDGTIYVRDIVDPSGETADVEIDCSRRYVLATEPKIALPVPRASVTLLQARRWRTETPAELAGSLTASDIEVRGRPWTPITISDLGGTGVRHRAARHSVSETGGSGTTAMTERTRELMEIFKVQRYILTARFGELDPLAPPIGQIIDLQNLNRFGFGASKKFLCIGAKASAERNRLELTLFG